MSKQIAGIFFIRLDRVISFGGGGVFDDGVGGGGGVFLDRLVDGGFVMEPFFVYVTHNAQNTF